jgi:hypothetical protein
MLRGNCARRRETRRRQSGESGVAQMRHLAQQWREWGIAHRKVRRARGNRPAADQPSVGFSRLNVCHQLELVDTGQAQEFLSRLQPACQERAYSGD